MVIKKMVTYIVNKIYKKYRDVELKKLVIYPDCFYFDVKIVFKVDEERGVAQININYAENISEIMIGWYIQSGAHKKLVSSWYVPYAAVKEYY